MDRLRDRICVVTGSTGSAAPAADRFAAEGAAVFIVSRTADHARGLAGRLEAGAARSAWVAADLTREVEAERDPCRPSHRSRVQAPLRALARTASMKSTPRAPSASVGYVAAAPSGGGASPASMAA